MMSESSLDDFFAKKDKSKKSKSKGKFTTSEEVTKKFEKSQRKSAFNEPTSTSSNIQSSITVSNIREDDEEWNEMEMEKEKDYSGLRIQALSIGEREKEEEFGKEQEPQENGDDSKVLEANVGPWKIQSSSAATPTTESEPLEREEEPRAEEESEVVEAPKAGAYRPPAMRYSSSSSQPGQQRRHGRNVPEIDSELHFPSLSQAADPTPKGSKGNSEKSFQSVKHGSRSKDDSLHQGVQLDLGNKYSALGSN